MQDTPVSLVVFGAGASAFSGELTDNSVGYRGFEAPPLTLDICEKIVGRANDIGPLLDLIRQERLADNFDFEATLRNIYQEFGKTSIWEEIFSRFRTEMGRLFSKYDNCTAEYLEKITNVALQSMAVCSERRDVAFVTLNYERLLENSAVPAGGTLNLNGRIENHPFSIFNPHGSVRWRWTTKVSGRGVMTLKSAGRVVSKGPFDASEKSMSIYLGQVGGTAPALALPMSGDVLGKFCWPKVQADELKQILPRVDRVAIIGWRGADDHVMSLLSDGLDDLSSFWVADPELEIAREFERTLGNKLKRGRSIIPVKKGFAGMFEPAELNKTPARALFS